MSKDLMDRLRRLKQVDENWEGTIRLARTWITSNTQAPYRPWLIALVDQKGRVLVSKLLEEPPTTVSVWETLSHAMHRPMFGAGRSRRPTAIYIDQEEHVQALAPQLEAIGVRCEYRRNLPELAEALASLERWMNRGLEPLPGLVTLPGMTLPLVEHLYTAAAKFHEAAPWRFLSDLHPIEIRYPPDDAPARYAVVMGSGGEVYGLSVQDTFADLQRMIENVTGQDLTGEISWLALSYEEAVAMSFDDLDAIERHGWPVPDERAYPVILRTRPKIHVGPPTRQDLLWLAGALPAINTYVNEHLKLQRGMVRAAELTLSVSILGSTEQVYLCLPTLHPEQNEGNQKSAQISTSRERSTKRPRSRRKIIERNLRKALLDDGPLSWALFEYELEEHIEEFIQSKRSDKDKYFFAVTENSNHVAMLLIDEKDVVHVNEEARAILRILWRKAYRENLERLIPDMAGELDDGRIYIAGVNVSK